MKRRFVCVFLILLLSSAVWSQDSGGSSKQVAKYLSNPVSTMTNIPVQFNYDEKLGVNDEGKKFTTNLQPVAPIPMGKNWRVISRTILPLINQTDIAPGSGRQSGIGDLLQSFFFSYTEKPHQTSDIVWGIGPALSIPTASDDLLGSGKWGAGPTFVVLQQFDQMTYGLLANEIWSYAGDEDRDTVAVTFAQPFFAYITPDAWTYALNFETTYDGQKEEWSVPVNFNISKVVNIQETSIQFGAGLRYWIDTPEEGPEGLGYRATATFLLPEAR